MTERDKMLAGFAYNPGDPALVQARARAKNLLRSFNDMRVDPAQPDDREKKDALIRELFGSCGGLLHVEMTFWCDYGCNIHVGDNFYANHDCILLDCAEIRIGRNCFLAPRVSIFTATHPLLAGERVRLDANGELDCAESAQAVCIGDDVWIGGGAIVNPGVTIGSNVVIGSGSVVTKDIPNNCVAAGNPARVIRRLPQSQGAVLPGCAGG